MAVVPNPFVTADLSMLDNFTVFLWEESTNHTCPESEWCHHQYTFCNFAARVLRTTALSMQRASVGRCFGYPHIGKKQCLEHIPNYCT